MVFVILDWGDIALERVGSVAIVIIARIAVDREEEDVRILILNGLDRRIELVTRHNNDFGAILYQSVDRSDTGGRGIGWRLLVFRFHIVGIAIVLHTFPAGFVEWVVVDWANIGDQTDFTRGSFVAACKSKRSKRGQRDDG